MNVLELFDDLKTEYKEYIRSFSYISDERIKAKLEEVLEQDSLWPKALIQFNPTFKTGRSVTEMIADGIPLHPILPDFFPNKFYLHQEEAIIKGCQDQEFVVTSGTGSGKSRTFMATIFNYILQNQNSTRDQTVAIVIYPMNSLINSQYKELEGYKENFQRLHDNIECPITFGQYTGQESEQVRQKLRENPPNILLTNYMMLELLLTRETEKNLRANFLKHLKFLVFDELHTYRGMQGSDVALLIRRIKSLAEHKVLCFGTSATMVSGNNISMQERKAKVAKVASCMFGSDITPEQIVEETLDSLSVPGNAKSNLKDCIYNNSFRDYALNSKQSKLFTKEECAQQEQLLLSHPTAIWLEHNIALNFDENAKKDVRGNPISLDEIAQKLCIAANLDPEDKSCIEACLEHVRNILLWSNDINQSFIAHNERKSVLPYKIHQFIRQTGTMYATLGDVDTRDLTIEDRLYFDRTKEDLTPAQQKLYSCCPENASIRYFPLLFSRYTGHEFYVVSLVSYNNNEALITPRDPDHKLNNNDDTSYDNEDPWSGYIVVPHKGQTAQDFLIDIQNEEFPKSWYTNSKHNALKKEYGDLLPKIIYFRPDGVYTFIEPTEEGFIEGIFVNAPLKFEPTAKLLFDRSVSDYPHLSKIGGEGRSTATTVLSYEDVVLMKKHGVQQKDCKVLTFVDARQDASLQAGHFNDFIRSGKIRAAILKAIENSDESGILYEDMASHVLENLKLDFSDYAINPNKVGSQKILIEETMLSFLTTMIEDDLSFNWSVNTPNLEDCNLVHVVYDGLKEEVFDHHYYSHGFWEQFNGHDNDIYDLIFMVLNYFRMNKALASETKNIKSAFKLSSKIKQDLKAPWTLLENDKIIPSNVIVIGKAKKHSNYDNDQYISAGPRSRFGRQLKSFIKKCDYLESFSSENDYIEFVTQLFNSLPNYIVLENDLYLLDPRVIKWLKPGPNNYYRKTFFNRVQLEESRSDELPTNKFYRDFYHSIPLENCVLEAKEHTGQVSKEEREEREVEFREGKFPILYCSPTMELGIDIKDLSIVGMRNVPPTPANYTQRAGRAGRSGQAALVYTFCKTKNPHDNYYLKSPEKMVNGVVSAPRMDLLNEDLLKAHLHSLILSINPIHSLGSCIKDIIDSTDEANNFPLRESIVADLELNDEQKTIIKDKFNAMLSDSYFVERQDSDNYRVLNNIDSWLDHQLERYSSDFNHAFDRWRDLLKIAYKNERDANQDPIDRQKNSDEKKIYSSNRQTSARKQTDLLLGNNYHNNQENEFYPYRYLAAEGFLPGYNFAKLPIRAFLQSANTSKDPESLSRPRALGLREFSPFNTIYCNGSKFKITKMHLAAGVTGEIFSFNEETGYLIKETSADGTVNKVQCVDLLTGSEMVKKSIGLCYQACNMSGDEIGNITCHEEERLSTGYKINTYLSFDSDNGIKQAKIVKNNDVLLDVTFIKTCRITYVLNASTNALSDDRFYLDTRSGSFISKNTYKELNDRYRKAGEDGDKAKQNLEFIKDIKLYTEDTADALYIKPYAILGLDGQSQRRTFAYAFKQALEDVLQVESSEIGLDLLGTENNPNIFLFESSEGALGVLKKVVDNSEQFKAIINRAYEICYQDHEYEIGSAELESLIPADYSNLLNYYNQPYHELIDIRQIYGPLKCLKGDQVKLILKQDYDKLQQALQHNDDHQTTLQTKEQAHTNAAFKLMLDYDQQYKKLLGKIDPNSSTELIFLQYLHEHRLRLPDYAQVTIDGVYVKPDFAYVGENLPLPCLLFCDGTPHDDPYIKQQDEQKRKQLKNLGYLVLVWHYSQSIDEFVEQNKDIIRPLSYLDN